MPPPESSPEAHRAEHMHRQIYVVKITDSYKKIAHRHHITVAELKEANHIHNNVLHTGQKLIIPSSGSLVAENASITSLESAPSNNALSESAAPMTTGLTSTTVATNGVHHHLYTVVKGDTLTRIAHRFRTSPSAIMAENGISDPTKLSIGKKLRIPSGESRSARVSTPASTQPGQVQAKGNAPTAQLANFAN
jgi:LysM repeat protein